MAKTDNMDIGYNGNVNLPKAGKAKNFSEHEISEIIKCIQDPIYFAETYFKIVHQDHGLIPFSLFPYQKEAITKFFDTGKLIMATARQVGKTSVATVMILHICLFSPHKNIAILANRKATAKEVLERIKLAYEYLPDFIKGGVKEWNKESIEFENGSKIFADATTGNSIRGKSLAMVYIDECAFVEDWETFSASVLPTLATSKKSKICLTSTPNGLNHFYDYYMKAKEKKNGFELIEVRWDDVPGRDEEWKQRTLQEMNFNFLKFQQEQEILFAGSSGTLISGSTLQQLEWTIPIHVTQNVNVYQMPVKEKKYVIIVDVSRGKGLDYSAFHVIDISAMPYNQVLVFRDNFIGPTDYAEMVYLVHKNYNDAAILVENNDIGGQVADLLHYEYEAESVLSTENAGRTGKKISGGFKPGSERGVRTTKSVKAIGCSLLKLLVEQRQIIINDKQTIEELSTFSKKGVSYEAEPGKNDDLVMGLVLFSWLTDQDYFKQETDINTLMRLKERNEDEQFEDLMPFGFNNSFEEHFEEQPRIRTVSDFEFGGGDW